MGGGSENREMLTWHGGVMLRRGEDWSGDVLWGGAGGRLGTELCRHGNRRNLQQ